jgi:NAD-specific glutamate dehydrogenase
VADLAAAGPPAVPGPEGDRPRRLRVELLAAGADHRLADGIAVLGSLGDAVELAGLAAATARPLAVVAGAHAALGAELDLPVLRGLADDQPTDSAWVLAARSTLRDRFDAARLALTGRLLRAGGEVSAFLAADAAAMRRFRTAGSVAVAARDDAVAVLAVVVDELERLAR